MRALVDLVLPVETWKPRMGCEETFVYVDLGAIDQESKTISAARRLRHDQAPSRARQLVKRDDVLVSTVRPNLNAVAVVPSNLDGAVVSTGFSVLRPRSSELDHRYLFHWVRTPTFVTSMVRRATGVSYPAVSDAVVLESSLPLPDIKEQRRIAEVLDRAEALRAKRRAALALLDTLTQSIFLEMFGEQSGRGRWERDTLGQVVHEFRYGTSNKSGDEGMPALRIPNVVSGGLDLSEIKLVSVEPAEFERLKLVDGDLLFVRTNGNPDYVGRCAVFEGGAVAGTQFAEQPFIFASYLIRARLRPKMSPVFLREFLRTDKGRRDLRSRCKTSAGQFNINVEGLGGIEVVVPPRDVQDSFAVRAAAVDKLKATHRASLAKLDELFASLQHRAFRGEL